MSVRFCACDTGPSVKRSGEGEVCENETRGNEKVCSGVEHTSAPAPNLLVYCSTGTPLSPPDVVFCRQLGREPNSQYLT